MGNTKDKNLKMTIKTIDSLLRQVWRYEPDILTLIFKFLFVPVYEDTEKKYRYIEALPKPGTTNINLKAFSNCRWLQSVIISNSVENIGDSAFYSCNQLQSVMIGKSVKTIGEYVFSRCRSLQSVTLGNSVESIGENVFFSCGSLKSITIPNSVKIIGEDAFAGCELLQSASIPENLSEIVRELEVFPKNTEIMVRS